MISSVVLAASLYLGLLLVIGLVSYWRFGRNTNDMALGGRSLNYFVTAIAAHASDMSAWLFMAYPAAVYAQGMVQLWTAIGLILFMYLNWHYVAPRLRRQSEIYGVSTLSGYFSAHFHDTMGPTSGKIRLVSSLMATLFFTAYLTSGFVALGTVFEATIGLPEEIGILIALGVIIAYTLVGGFVAVAWNDFFQGIFLLGVIIYVPILLYHDIPSLPSDTVSELWARFFEGWNRPQQVLTLLFGWGLGYFGQPHILSKFMGIGDPNKLHYAKWIGISWQTIVLGAASTIGLLGIFHQPSGMENPELLFVMMVRDYFTPFWATIMLCAILAATLSSLDAYLLAAASTVSEDLYPLMVRAKPSPIAIKRFFRLAILLISGAAYFLAIHLHSTLWDLVSYSWSGLGATFGPLVLASFFSNKIPSHAAFTGILLGGATAALWPLLGTDIPSLLAGFTLNSLSIFLLHRYTATPKRAITI